MLDSTAFTKCCQIVGQNMFTMCPVNVFHNIPTYQPYNHDVGITNHLIVDDDSIIGENAVNAVNDCTCAVYKDI